MPKRHPVLVAEDDPGWLRFWAAYPRRDAKLVARKAWARLSPDTALVDHMIAALFWQRQQRSWQEDRHWIPLPASWLNGERWTDDPPAGQCVPADIRGHEPPCQTFAACQAKALAEARAVNAARHATHGPDAPLVRKGSP